MLKLYNTLTKSKEEFKPLNPGKVFMYSCGPTVYDYIHIGNIRAYTVADILRRYLTYLGYEVRHIKNITDVGHLTQDDIGQGDTGEDKFVKKARTERKTPKEIAEFYENYFHEVEKEMNILPAHKFPKASAYVSDMIKIISALTEKGIAYEKNGNVFFDVTKFKNYGKLSGNTLDKLKVGARLEEHPDKKHPWDFALWLKAPKEHLLKWKSPWSIGYPGWHIECSAMSNELLGDTIDIHTGGEDNIFPHHEAEIAQSESYTGKKFVNYWVHNRHLLVNGEKMAKSKGNFYVLEDIKEKGFEPMALRMLLLGTQHRKQLNFTWPALEQAKANYGKLVNFYERLSDCQSPAGVKTEKVDIEKFKNNFENAMNDDLNTPNAIAAVLDLISQSNVLIDKQKLENSAEIKEIFKKALGALGIKIRQTLEIPREIKKLADEREKAREDKDFPKADQLRKEMEKKGFILEDTKEGYKIKKG